MKPGISPQTVDLATFGFAMAIVLSSIGVMLLGGPAFICGGELVYTSQYISSGGNDSITFILPSVLFGCYLVFFSWLPHRKYLLKFIMFFLFWLFQLPNWFMEMASFSDMIRYGGNWPVAILLVVYAASPVVIPALWIIQVRTCRAADPMVNK